MDASGEIFKRIIGILAFCVSGLLWFAKKNLENIETSASKLGESFLVFKDKTQTQLAILNQTAKAAQNDISGITVSLDNLKKEMQQVHIQNAKIDIKEVKENFGKVIVLDERSRAFETMHRMTAKEIADIKSRLPK